MTFAYNSSINRHSSSDLVFLILDIYWKSKDQLSCRIFLNLCLSYKFSELTKHPLETEVRIFIFQEGINYIYYTLRNIHFLIYIKKSK